MPNKTTLQAMITTHIYQRYITNGYRSLRPSISVGVTLPKEHPIWKTVKEGDFAGLRSLLDQGKASLRSYDEDGASLLHVLGLVNTLCGSFMLIEVVRFAASFTVSVSLKSQCRY